MPTKTLEQAVQAKPRPSPAGPPSPSENLVAADEPNLAIEAPSSLETLNDRWLEAVTMIGDVPKNGRLAVGSNREVATLTDADMTAAVKRILPQVRLRIKQEMIGIKRTHRTLQKVDFNSGREFQSSEYETIIEWRFTIYAIGTPESETVKFYSEGVDPRDKGISKTTSIARKDFLRTYFMVEGEEDQIESKEPGTPRKRGAQAAPVQKPAPPVRPPPKATPHTPNTTKETGPAPTEGTCILTGEALTKAVIAFTHKTYQGRLLCMNAQKQVAAQLEALYNIKDPRKATLDQIDQAIEAAKQTTNPK